LLAIGKKKACKGCGKFQGKQMAAEQLIIKSRNIFKSFYHYDFKE
jgi:hypothetical protein